MQADSCKRPKRALSNIKTHANFRAIAVAAEGLTAAAFACASPSSGGSRAANLPSLRNSSICSQCKSMTTQLQRRHTTTSPSHIEHSQLQLHSPRAQQRPVALTGMHTELQLQLPAGLTQRVAHQTLGALANTLDVRYILAALDLCRPVLDNIGHLLQCACCIDSIPTCDKMQPTSGEIASGYSWLNLQGKGAARC